MAEGKKKGSESEKSALVKASSNQDMKGKVALVTGATSGIGLETAVALASQGATVILGCRNLVAARDVAAKIRERVPGARIDVPKAPLDLMSSDSVRAFAAEVDAAYPELHVLVNNAGVSFMKRTITADGIGGIAQANYLGPYLLTRLLEKKLVASKARIVSVCSIKHREVRIKNARAMLTDWRCGYYEFTKLANVMFAYELQRRLGLRGVTSVAADPGGVRSNIWSAAPMFQKGFYRTMVDMCYSPPEDGAKAVIHAATVTWQANTKRGADGKPVSPAQDLRYYSRGLFNNYIITNVDGLVGGKSIARKAARVVWALTALTCSLLDWPLRNLTGGRIAGVTRPVRSSTVSYDEQMAKELWEVSAELTKLPVQPQI